MDIKQGYSLIPVSRLEQLFSEGELNNLAYWEFLHLEQAMSQISKIDHPGGMNRAEMENHCQYLLALHFARWGARSEAFHARVIKAMPDMQSEG